MAFKFSFTFLLLLLLLILPQFTIKTAAQETSHHDLKDSQIADVLSSKGYVAMALVLDQTLKTLVPAEPIHNTTVTIFCPSDKAFFSLKYPQPPLTLLQYHVVPVKLDREDLASSLAFESKIDTLLPGHPLVITTIPGSKHASINNVKITAWNIYNDGHVIVHGIDDFFDPAFQILIYPWYDGGASKSNSSSSMNVLSQEVDHDSLCWVKSLVLAIIVLALIGIVISIFAYIRRNHFLPSYFGYVSIDYSQSRNRKNIREGAKRGELLGFASVRFMVQKKKGKEEGRIPGRRRRNSAAEWERASPMIKLNGKERDLRRRLRLRPRPFRSFPRREPRC
ncbi:hypothetical protein F0562_030407 [Nyssa sinensis]|uniref:FAS1 domain-containing protein n=1 Tax=Nyssa sinensis TaxID=561372 RepID=A0A5J5AY93_9ASTE|nr:hypothetical protein F0562_030407 [Nyssa sinensis]